MEQVPNKERLKKLHMKDLYTKYIGENVQVIIDRPFGSNHPKHGFRYEVNYGYVPDTLAPDGDEIDAYVLGIDKPIETFSGKCIAIIHRLNDNDDKLVIVPENSELITDDEIVEKTLFQEKYFISTIIRK
ncbi:MAG: inorganic diphosphatase [bacterium]